LVDGGFAFDIPAGSTSTTVTATVGGAPVIRTFTFPAVSAATDVGDLYIGPEEVTVTGRVSDAGTGGGLAGATVKMAGRSAVSGADGRFSIPLVAYASSASAVFLGLQGEASQSGYFASFFSPGGLPVGGTVDVGSVALSSAGGDDPPPPPSNIRISVGPDGAGAVVELRSGSTIIRTGVASGSGAASFWAPVGTYTVRAVKGARTGTSPASVTSVNLPVSVNVVLS
jgi:hypothetical protein